MITSATPSCCPSAHQATQQAFLGILPRLKLHGKVYFRDLKDPERREEAMCEMLALAWSWFVRLAERGTWVEPELFCQVRFLEWTHAGRLRGASFQSLLSETGQICSASAREVSSAGQDGN